MAEHPAAWRQQACYQRIYDIVREIPHGHVMTYGQIAGLVAEVCGSGTTAILVGRAMAASGHFAPDLPWWRVIGKEGDRGILRKRRLQRLQRELLALEGVVSDHEGCYDLAVYQHHPAEA